MKLITDEDFQTIADLTIAHSVRYYKHAQSTNLLEIFNRKPQNLNESLKKSLLLKKELAAMTRNFVDEMRKMMRDKFPDTAFFFVGEDIEGRTKEQTQIITQEALLIDPVINRDRIMDGTLYDFGISVGLVRNQNPADAPTKNIKPVYGVYTSTLNGFSIMTRENKVFVYRQYKPDKINGEYEPCALEVRSALRRHGFPEEMKRFRRPGFPANLNVLLPSASHQSIVMQFSSVS
jgi:hypothetical protein